MKTVQEQAKTVIVSGHGDGLTIAGQSARQVADAVAAYAPELVVLDASFASPTPLLSALASKTRAIVIAAPSLVEGSGLVYDPPLFGDDSASERALAVNTEPPSRLYVGRPNVQVLAEVEAEIAALSADALRPRVRVFGPRATLVEHTLPDGQTVLVPVPWQKIVYPPPPRPSNDDVRRSRFAVRALWLPGTNVNDRSELDAPSVY